jgi:sugar lactone lactonase YvrE
MTSSTRPIAALVLTAGLLTACGEGISDATCDTVGAGTLIVNIGGLPTGLPADVVVSGPGGTFTLTATTSTSGLAAGSYTILAANVSQADSIADRVFRGTPPANSFCVRNGATRSVAVPHTQIATSQKVWVGSGFYSLGFSTSLLGSTNTIAPTVSSGTRGGTGLLFDAAGNLWVLGQSTADPTLMRYPASALGVTANPLPDRSITISNVNCNGPGSLAWDVSGNLWVSIGCQGRVIRLTPAQLGTSGTILPSVQITNLTRPVGLAFDGPGNLWIADSTHLRRFDAARLGASTGAAADLSATFTTPSPRVAGQFALSVRNLAVNPDGDLWASTAAQQALFRVEAAVTGASGTLATEVSRIVYLTDFASPRGFAFDNSGALWVGYTQSTFARFGPAQLDASSTPAAPTTPGRIFASGNILGFADDVGMYRP